MKHMKYGPDEEEDDEDTEKEHEWSVEEELSDKDEYPTENFPDCDP